MTESLASLPRPNPVRLVVADVDGTLTPDKVVTSRARAAVRQVVEANIAFTITSGRPPKGVKALIDDLQLRAPIAAFNGGLFVRPDLSVLRRHVIPREVATTVIGLLTRGGLDVWLYTEEDWYVIVSTLSTWLRIPSTQIATIGDMPSDVLMFERSGLSIAMANADAEVSRAAMFVTSSNTDEGFALAIEGYVLGNAQDFERSLQDACRSQS